MAEYCPDCGAFMGVGLYAHVQPCLSINTPPATTGSYAMTGDTQRERIARIIECHIDDVNLKLADRILAELGGGWRNIADAPRNQYVLVAIPGLDTPLIYGLLEFEGDPDLPRWYSADDSVGSPLDIEPTHWMPLPPPPGATP